MSGCCCGKDIEPRILYTSRGLCETLWPTHVCVKMQGLVLVSETVCLVRSSIGCAQIPQFVAPITTLGVPMRRSVAFSDVARLEHNSGPTVSAPARVLIRRDKQLTHNPKVRGLQCGTMAPRPVWKMARTHVFAES